MLDTETEQNQVAIALPRNGFQVKTRKKYMSDIVVQASNFSLIDLLPVKSEHSLCLCSSGWRMIQAFR